jgi:hypothetical protein
MVLDLRGLARKLSLRSEGARLAPPAVTRDAAGFFDFGSFNTNWVDTYSAYDWQFNHDLTVNTFKVGVNSDFNNIYSPLK